MFGTIGVPITVTRPSPDDTPVTTSGIWMALSADETRPIGVDFQHAAPRKVLAIRLDAALPTIPRGSLVLAPDLQGGTVKSWRVDRTDRPYEVDEFRVLLVQTADT